MLAAWGLCLLHSSAGVLDGGVCICFPLGFQNKSGVLGLREMNNSVTFKLETKGHPELHVRTDTEQGHFTMPKEPWGHHWEHPAHTPPPH